MNEINLLNLKRALWMKSGKRKQKERSKVKPSKKAREASTKPKPLHENTNQKAHLNGGTKAVREESKNEPNLAEDVGGQKQKKQSSKASKSKKCKSEEDYSYIAPAVGLENTGTNCYANSGIQCLLCVPELNEYIIKEQYKDVIKKESKIRFLEAVSALYKRIFETKAKFSVSTSKLISQFHVGESDTHEFLWHNLFPCLQIDPFSPSQQIKNIKRAYFVLDFLFGGKFEGKVSCKSCGHESFHYDVFFDISLPIKGNSLCSSLKTYFEPENMGENEAYYCGACEKTSAAVKNSRICMMPKYLILHLKRVVFGEEKISRFIEYPLELDLSKQEP
jgi:ubiquitin C-terminal hydrolase